MKFQFDANQPYQHDAIACDFLKLRTSEADKVRCGATHFETLGVSFKVVVHADDV